MTAPALAPAPSGTDPTGKRTAVGSDDLCERLEDGVRCETPAVRRVLGDNLCEKHAREADAHLRSLRS